MSAIALAVILTAALLIGTAVIAVALVKRATRPVNGAPLADSADGPTLADGATTTVEARPKGGGPTPSDDPGNDHRDDLGDHRDTDDHRNTDGIDDHQGRRDDPRDLLLLRMSHDIRGPLGSVATLCDLLVEGDAGPLNVKQHQYVEVIRRSGQSVLALMDDILDLAAMDSGRSAPEIAACDLAVTVQDAVEHGERAAREKGIPLQADLPREALLARADQRRLGHILGRMIEHVLHATDHGYVEVAAVREGGQALLRVHNTRDGLSDKARRILARDHALDHLGAPDGGMDDVATPLPLAIAALLARRLGAPLAMRSGPDEGLILELALPLAAAADGPAPRLDDPKRTAVHGQRILLVDDDAVETAHVAGRLAAAGYHVESAASGKEGLKRLRDESFDAVVLDLVMPGLSGLEVLRAVRAERRLDRVPFVVLSALYMTQGERAVLGPGVAGVVRKGDATADELLRALGRALAPSHPGEPAFDGGGRHV